MTHSLVRLAACSTISGSGGLITGLMLVHTITNPLPLAGLLLAGFGGLIGLALVVAGGVLYRTDVTTRQTVRIAGWNGLGIVVIGAAMALFYTYQAAVGRPPPNPVFSGAVVVGVSAVAHVLIGANDVRRIRAEELATERQKLAVLTRLVRHNLRTQAQLLYSAAGQLTDNTQSARPPDEIADDIQTSADTFSEMHENIKLLQEVIDHSLSTRPVELHSLVSDCIADLQARYPAATIESDISATITVRAGPYLEDALAEVIENAIIHSDAESPHVTLELFDNEPETVVLSVQDNGPGIPDHERGVILSDQSPTQLDHASGLGLWLVRWILDAYDGELDIRQPTKGGSDIRLRLPAV